MATLEDKILGEKSHNYCSSSSENSDSEDDSPAERNVKKEEENAEPLPEVGKWEGSSTNTGPKGVIKDWQRYKQLKNEQREESERERIELVKKLTMTVQSALDEEREKAEEEDPELAELLKDEFLESYQKQRMKEMLEKSQHKLKFGQIVHLNNGDDFLQAIDEENKAVTVIIHISEDRIEACRTMNVCLKDLCKIYPEVKFCTILGSNAGLSKHFKVNGVPALLVYKAGQMVGNFVKLADELGNDFSAEDVQGYLVEHGMLEDKSCTPFIVRKGGDSDSGDDD